MPYDATDLARAFEMPPIQLEDGNAWPWVPAQTFADALAVRQARLALLDLLRSVPPEKFDMSTWGRGMEVGEALTRPYAGEHICGTVACIGGWMERLLYNPKPSNVPCLEYVLGLSPSMRKALFYPWEAYGSIDDEGHWMAGEDDYFLQADAIAAVSHLIDTNEVHWERAEAEYGAPH